MKYLLLLSMLVLVSCGAESIQFHPGKCYKYTGLETATTYAKLISIDVHEKFTDVSYSYIDGDDYSFKERTRSKEDFLEVYEATPDENCKNMEALKYKADLNARLEYLQDQIDELKARK